MMLPPALAVGFAVSDGQPTDARSWVTVDFDGHLSPVKRGYLVATEPTEYSTWGRHLAHTVREIILNDLRRQQGVPADLALGRALARANNYVHHELTTGEHASFDRRIFVGATAVVLDDHTMTVAHVPPGQLVMIEDGLVYAVPELESWRSDYFGDDRGALGPPDPLGYSAQVRPHMAVTELRPGDVLALIDSQSAGEFALQLAGAGMDATEMQGLFGRDPDHVLDVFRSVVIQGELAEASVAVLALPPLPGALQIQTLGDIGRRVRDEWRHTRAFAREWSPTLPAKKSGNPFRSQPPAQAEVNKALLKPMVEIPEYHISSAPPQVSQPLPARLAGELQARPDPYRAERRKTWRERLTNLAERGTPRWVGTWRQPSQARQFGIPGTHGVRIFRNSSTLMGEPSWRNYLPRLPLLSAGILWIFVVLLIVGAVVGGAFVLDQRRPDEADFTAVLSQIDQQIIGARAIADPGARGAAFDKASTMITDARTAGAPEDALRQRAAVITSEQDVLNNVIRVNDVQRLGTVPEDFKTNPPQIVQTAVGTFIVAGSLYQLDTESPQLVKVLTMGETVDGAPIKPLFGVAADAEGIYATDGEHLFIRDATGEWSATELKELNQLGPWNPGHVDAFGGNVYLLQQEFLDIYKFLANPENGVATGDSWVLEGVREGLDEAVDIAIDGNIYVLLEDGSIRRYRMRDLQSTQTPDFLNVGQPVALLNGAATGYLYVVVSDGGGASGRVLAFDFEGLTTYQVELPDGFSTGSDDVLAPFEQVQDIAVDETSGTMYVVNGDGVWSMRYTLPLLDRMIQPDATPEAGT